MSPMRMITTALAVGLLAASANMASAGDIFAQPMPQLPEDKGSNDYVPPPPPLPEYKPPPPPPKPVPTPDYPVFTPDYPVPTPDYPTHTPDYPAPTPDYPTEAPHPPKPAYSKPSPYVPDNKSNPGDSCTSGPGLRRYKQAFTQGEMVFAKSFKFLDKDCHKLDTLYASLKKKCPYKETCMKKGYLDAVEQSYTAAQDNCVSDCAGIGQETGNNLGTQFCSLAQGGPQAALALDSPTVQICNAVESTMCYSAMDDYVHNNCPDALDANMDFYNSLSDVCQITSRR